MSKAERLKQEQAEMRALLYGDGYECKDAKNCTYSNYILDNSENVAVLDEILNSKGINLVVADTGSGKSHSMLERAKVLVQNNKDRKTFNQYKKIHKIIVQNNVLSKFKGCTVNEIPSISETVKDRTQICVFCYLRQQGQKTYTVTKELAQEIVDVFKKVFPMSKKVPTVKGVMKLMREMYQTKGADKIRTELRTSYDNVFKLVESDY